MSVVTDPPPGTALPTAHPAAPAVGAALPAHDAECFGCGPQNAPGLHLVSHRLPDGAGGTLRTVSTFTVAPHHQGGPGIAHGGVLTAALDDALGMLLHVLRVPAVTARLETDFRAPVPQGALLHVVSECTGRAGRKVYGRATGRVGGAEGPVAVEATALFVVVGLEHFDRHGSPGAREKIVGSHADRPVRFSP